MLLLLHLCPLKFTAVLTNMDWDPKFAIIVFKKINLNFGLYSKVDLVHSKVPDSMGSPRIAAATDSAQGRAILLTRRRSKDSKRRKKKTPSLEEQYEAETAGMSAAERLRFLRKK
ncbi:hypothetical protein PF004_g32167, partial [Phytophthora fragariae]